MPISSGVAYWVCVQMGKQFNLECKVLLLFCVISILMFYVMQRITVPNVMFLECLLP
jgi:hypothetical protein